MTMRIPNYIRESLIALLIFLLLGQWLSLGFLIVLSKLWPGLIEVKSLFLTNIMPHLAAGGLFLIWHFAGRSQTLIQTIVRCAICHAVAYMLYDVWVLMPLAPPNPLFLYSISFTAGAVSGACCGAVLYYALRPGFRLHPAPIRASESPASTPVHEAETLPATRFSFLWHSTLTTLLFALAGPPVVGMVIFFTTSRYIIDLASLLFFYSYGLLPALLAGIGFSLWAKWQSRRPPFWQYLMRGAVCAATSCAVLVCIFALWQGEDLVMLLPIFLIAAIPAGMGCAMLVYVILHWTARKKHA